MMNVGDNKFARVNPEWVYFVDLSPVACGIELLTLNFSEGLWVASASTGEFRLVSEAQAVVLLNEALACGLIVGATLPSTGDRLLFRTMNEFDAATLWSRVNAKEKESL